MTANNKEEFFSLLETELKRIGVENFDEIKEDFEQHFEESAEQGVSEEDTAFRLGDVKEIARNYLNLESSRLNSIIARDHENTGKKVSLTKPGQSVPADLSLLDGKDIQNSDCIREYTPEHISAEIYPNRGAENNQSSQSLGGQQSSFINNSSNSIPNNNFTSSSTNSSTTNQANGTATNSNASANDVNSNVADAFSNAGKAVAEAARATGQALAEAFGKNGVKGAVINAGKTTADAVKIAGQSAADAVKNASQNAKSHKRCKNHGVPTPNDDFRENINNSHTGTIPDGAGSTVVMKGGFTFESVKGKQPNVNASKLVGAIMLDIFVWSWLVPLIFSAIIALFGAGIGLFVQNGIGTFTGFVNMQFHFISRIFLGIGFCALGGILMTIAGGLFKPWIKLLKHIGTLHIKAIYDI